MNPDPARVVYDCVIFVQALISGRGPASACIDRALAGDVRLFLSDAILAEIRDVTLRPDLTRRYAHLSPERVADFIREIEAVAIHLQRPSNVFVLPRDPKDEPYTDLSIAVDAEFLVTWNEKHLTYLMRGDTPEGASFIRKFPKLRILPPPQFLRELQSRGS